MANGKRPRLASDRANYRRVYDICLSFRLSQDFSAFLQQVVNAAIDFTDADMGNVQLLDGPTGSLKIAASRGFAAPFLEFFKSVTFHSNSACGAALSTRQRVIVENVALSPLFVGTPALDVMLAAQARAVHSMPLISGSGRFRGVLSVHWRQPQTETGYDVTLLDFLALEVAEQMEQPRDEAVLRVSA
jgi:GAF domain-containing protein